MGKIRDFFDKEWPIFVLLALVVGFYFAIIFRMAFLTNDLIFLHLPAKEYLFSRLKDLALPFWDPYTLSGRPFLADPQVAVFNPLNLVILPFWREGNLDWNFWLLEIEAIFSIFVGGVFIYLLMKEYGLSLAGCLFSALIFMFGGFTTGHIIHLNMLQAVIFLPLILLFFRRALIERKTQFAVVAGVFLAFSTLAGHSQMSYYIILFLLAYFLYFWVFEARFKKSLRLFLMLLVTFLFGFGLSSLQLLPTFELSAYSQRMEKGYSGYQFASSYSLPPVHLLIESFLPHFFANTDAGSQLLGPYACCPWEYTSYVGSLTILLIIFGLISSKAKEKNTSRSFPTFSFQLSALSFDKEKRGFLKFEKWFFFFILVVSLLISFGYHTPIYKFLYFFLPGFGLFRVPARFLFFAQFASAILAGKGLDFLNNFYLLSNSSLKSQLKQTTGRILRLAILGFLFLILILVYFISFGKYPFFSSGWPAIVRRDFLVFLAALLSGLFFVTLLVRDKKFLKLANLGLILLLFFELMFAAQNFRFINGEYLASDYYPSFSSNLLFAEEKIHKYRVLSRPFLSLNAGLIYKIPTIEGWQSLILARYNHLLNIDFLYPAAEVHIEENKRVLDLLNTKYIFSFSGGNWFFYQNQDALPRAFFVPHAQPLDEAEILEAIKRPDYNPREIIYLSKEDFKNANFDRPDTSLTNPTEENKVEILGYAPEKIIIETQLQEGGWLFLSEAFYPGWQAFVDGKEEKIYRANYYFRALPVSFGNHRIELYFRPRSFKFGLVLSLFTLAGAILLLLPLGKLLNFVKKR